MDEPQSLGQLLRSAIAAKPLGCKDLHPAFWAGEDMRIRLQSLVLHSGLRESPNKDDIKAALVHVTQALELLGRVHISLD
jgi:hypothetical protein